MSQLTSLLQETTEEKSESIIVSAYCRFIMKFKEILYMIMTAHICCSNTLFFSFTQAQDWSWTKYESLVAKSQRL